MHPHQRQNGGDVQIDGNSFRDVNIAFANELAIICDKLGIKV
jgi:UDP-N-acetyl-D-mannosaminuronate dehydrogenase